MAVPGSLAPLRPDVRSSYTAVLTDLVYETPFRVGPDGELVPVLAERWERLGSSRFRMTIRPGVRFSDGSPLAVADVIPSLAAAGVRAREQGEWLDLEPASAGEPIEPLLLYALVFKPTSGVPLGTGPYAFVEGDERHVVLRRVRPDPGRIAEVEMVAYPSLRDAFARLLRSEVNAALGLEERQLELLEGMPQVKVVRSPGPHAAAVFMNAVRLDRAARRDLVAALQVPEVAAAYGADCHPEREEVPIEKPLPFGRELAVHASNSEGDFARLALAVRRALGRRGGRLVLEDVARFEERRRRLDYDLAVAPMLVSPPSVFALYLQTRGPWNWSGYSNPAFDRLVEAGDMAGARAELDRDPALVRICRRDRFMAVDSRIRNPTLSQWGVLETLPDWEVAP
jgi:MarR-like DNA-binding transcriptional regulator SgrR of sgrS sRNA